MIKSKSLGLSAASPYGLLLLLVVIFLWPMFFGGKLPFLRDMFFDFLPQHLFAKQIFWSGHIPFWNPHAGSGKPFVADPQTATFYPLHAVFYIFPAPSALRIYCAAHLWLGGAGIFALARHWRMQVAPALVAALSCMFSSWAIASLEFANNLGAAVWAPWIVLTVSHIERTMRTKCVPGQLARLVNLTFALAVLFTIQYLAGFPEFLVYTTLLAATYAAGCCMFHRAARALIGTLGCLGAAGLLSILISAPQLLLSLEFLPLSERGAAINPGLKMASLRLRDCLQFLFPFINGRPGYSTESQGHSTFEFWIGTCYVGILPLLLVLFAVLVFRRGRSRRDQKFLCAFLFAATAFGILMALGKNTPLYQFLYDHVPGFDHFRFPSKFLVLVLFTISLLAGLGWQEILRIRKWPALGTWTAPALIFLNLFFVTRDLHHMVDESLCRTKPTNALAALPDRGKWRVHSVYGPVQQWLYASQDAALIEWALSAGVGDSWLPFGINATWQGGQKLKRYFTLYYLLWSLPPDKAEKLANLLSVRYTLTGAPFDQIRWHGATKALELVEHRNPRPRAFLSANWILCKRVDDTERARSQILEKLLAPDFYLGSTAIVETESGTPEADNASVESPTPSISGNAGEVLSLQDHVNEVRAQVKVKTKALFVLNDAWYPGWTAHVDGASTPIFRTNFDFRGVFIDPGEHDLVFTFAANNFRVGVWVAVSTIVLMCILLVVVNIRATKSEQ